MSALVRPPANVQILEMGGRDRLRYVLDLVLEDARKIGGLQALGIVRDADDRPPNAFQSVPRRAPIERAHSAGSARRVRGKRQAGGGRLHHARRKLTGLAGVPLRQVGERGIGSSLRRGIPSVCREGPEREWNAAKRDKAFAYAYMATSADPENHLNVGAAQGTWNRDSPAFGRLRPSWSSWGRLADRPTLRLLSAFLRWRLRSYGFSDRLLPPGVLDGSPKQGSPSVVISQF